MIKATIRLLLVVPACLLAMPGGTLAGGFCLFHGNTCHSTVTTTGAPASTYTQVVPAQTFTQVVPAQTFTQVVPAQTFAQVVPAQTFAQVVPAQTFTQVVPAQTFAHVVPASSFVGVTPAAAPASWLSMASQASPLAQLAASNFAQASAPAAAPLAFASAQAAAATPFEAAAAGSNYPMLAQAALSRGVHGGRFVMFLKHAIRGSLTELGHLGTEAKPYVRDILTGLIQSQLGMHPGALGLAGEVEKLLGEFFGGGGGGDRADNLGGISGGGAGGHDITICITVDGARVTGVKSNPPVGGGLSPNVGSGGGVGGGPVVAGRGRPIPSMTPSMPMPQVQPAPLDDTPPVAPVPVVDSTDRQREEAGAKDIREIKESLKEISASLKKVADKK